MAGLNILYLAAGGQGSTSMAKAAALGRLGHRLLVVNLYDCVRENIWLRRLDNYTGYTLRQRGIAKFLLQNIQGRTFDLAWVDSGTLVGPKVTQLLRVHAKRLINYNHDDPTGTRDGNVWLSFKAAVPAYDLLVTVRPETEQELKQLGARQVVRVWRSYDELEHRPLELSADDHRRWDSEVVFVGTWMRERGPFMAELIGRGLPLTLYGDLWHRASEWNLLRAAWRGPAVYGGEYAKAVQCSKIALGLLSKGNRDLHTTRSAEIPAMGGLFCAERTSEHLELYGDGEEAVFWSDADECASVCRRLLGNAEERERIRRRGRERVIALGLGHERILASVLERALE